MGLQGGAAFGGRHLGHGHGGHQVHRRRIPARLDRGRALHLCRHHPRHCHGAAHLPRLRPQQARTSARRRGAGRLSIPLLLVQLHGTHRHHRLQQLVSHHALLRDHPLPRMDHHSEATDPLQHCGGYPVRHRRGLRGLRRHRRVLAALRRLHHAGLGSLAELPRAVHGEVRAGTLYDAAHGHSVHRGGPAGTHHRAYHRARTQLQPVERRHLDEPHLHHRVCLLCGPRIAKRRRGPR